MPSRRQDETIEQFAIRVCYETGHFWGASNPGGWNIRQDDLQSLTARDPIVIEAIRSYTMQDATAYTQATLNHHGRTPDFDGVVGPAVEEMIQVPRCPVPDNAPPPGVPFAFADPYVQRIVELMQANEQMPVQASGGWAGCHGVGNFHCAIARWDVTRKPAHLPDETFHEILRKVQRAYAAIGLLWRFVGADGVDLLNGENLSTNSVNTDATFVPSSDGWIGLAILGRNEKCTSQIWARFLATFRGGPNNASVVNQWWTLMAHEFMHNCGRSHTNGGVMNPSLMSGLPMDFNGDTSESWLRGQFGGQPVPIPGGGSPEPPAPPSDIQSQLDRLRIKDIVQDVQIQWNTQEIRKLRGDT